MLAFVYEKEWDAEVVVVNDGSTDNTAEIVRRYAEQHAIVRLVENPANHGKGYTVRNGVMNAKGAFLLFTDADLSAPIEEATKLFAALEQGADIAIGSRWVKAELQTHRQSALRQVLGRAFNVYLRVMLRLDFADTQCGFKAFRRNAARTIFPMQRIEGWGFDPEILFLAQKAGMKIAEVPVIWGHDERTRIHPLVDGSRMLMEITRIRWYALSGQYGKAQYGEPKPVKVQKIAAQRQHRRT